MWPAGLTAVAAIRRRAGRRRGRVRRDRPLGAGCHAADATPGCGVQVASPAMGCVAHGASFRLRGRNCRAAPRLPRRRAGLSRRHPVSRGHRAPALRVSSAGAVPPARPGPRAGSPPGPEPAAGAEAGLWVIQPAAEPRACAPPPSVRAGTLTPNGVLAATRDDRNAGTLTSDPGRTAADAGPPWA